MKKIIFTLCVALMATFSFARNFDGTEKIYLKANAVSWWIDANAAQRAVLNNETSVIGVIEDADRYIYAFTIPAGDYTTIRFERAENAEAAAWNVTGDIVIPAEGDYVTAFGQNSTEATWDTYVPAEPAVFTTHNLTITNNTGWDNFYVYAWGDKDAFGTWPGSTSTTLEFEDIDGAVNLHLIMHNNVGEGQDGDRRVLFDITEARDYSLIVTDQGAYEQGAPEPVYTTYHLYASNQTTWEVFDLYAWGNPNDAFGAWPGTTNPATTTIDGVVCNVYDFTVVEGATIEMHLIFHNNVGEGQEGDHRQLYDITETRDYKITVRDDGIIEGLAGESTIEENTAVKVKSVKQIINGQIFIHRNGKTYNALGAEVGRDAILVETSR